MDQVTQTNSIQIKSEFTVQSTIINHKMSLLRAQDYLYDHPKHVPNIYWSELIKTIDEFDQLMEIEKKQISDFLKEKIHKKVDMIRKFFDYKESIRFVGETVKKDLAILDKEKFQLFFMGYFREIKHIIHFVLSSPQKFAAQIVDYKCHKKYNFSDFCQNIPVMIYPYYMPLSQKKTNNCLQFIEEIINLWPYSVQYARPKYHSLIDEIIYGFLKTPPILCYVQKISAKFLKEIGNCRMEIFAFDEDAIKNQIDIKKHATVSYTQPEKKSLKWKIKNFFKGGKDDNSITQETMIKESMTAMAPDKSQSQYSNVPDMMKRRQTSFIQLIKNTVENILNQQPPFLLKKMMQFFRKKVQIQLMKQNKPLNVQLKHYSYFLLTNFICAQLHNKFTIAHEQTGMTNADLQNIAEIIKIISTIFQGHEPQLKRSKTFTYTLSDYKTQVLQFYANFFQTEMLELQEAEQSHQGHLKQILINYYQSNILLSFNDVKILVDVYHQVRCKELKGVCDKLAFLEKADVRTLFQPNKKVKFENVTYSAQNVLFLQDWSQKTKKEILDYLVVNEQPLQYLPMLRDVFFFSSNLNVEESLEVAQDLKLIKKMPLKNIKQYLIKTANKFTHLNIKDFFTLQKAFKDTLKKCLQNNLKRKECILYCRSEILYQLEQQNDFIDFFINELKSQQFYQKISESFLHNIKIKAYVNIENHLLKVHKDMKDLKGLGISNLMLASNDKGSQKSNEEYILRNSFKTFDKVNELMRCIGKNQITKCALLAGRKVQEWNLMFTQAIDIVISHIVQFIKIKSTLQSLSKAKLETLIIKKLQNMIYVRHCMSQKPIDDDKKLTLMSTLIDKQAFYHQQIAQHQIQTQFLVQQAKQKFTIMISQNNVTNKIVHLKELFNILMTVLGFTLRLQKVSSDIMTPMLQFIILECADIGHFRCLYSMECLKYSKNPELDFMITNYRSALMYIKENMAMDYTKKGCEEEVKSHFHTGLNKDS